MYKDLKVYQRAYKLSISIYKFAGTLPKDEQFGFTSQLKRAATSIPLNIAEGYGKEDSKPELKRFLRMAKGSCSEMEVLLDMCRDLDFLDSAAHERYSCELREINAMLYGLLQSVND